MRSLTNKQSLLTLGLFAALALNATWSPFFHSGPQNVQLSSEATDDARALITSPRDGVEYLVDKEGANTNIVLPANATKEQEAAARRELAKLEAERYGDKKGATTAAAPAPAPAAGGQVTPAPSPAPVQSATLETQRCFDCETRAIVDTITAGFTKQADGLSELANIMKTLAPTPLLTPAAATTTPPAPTVGANGLEEPEDCSAVDEKADYVSCVINNLRLLAREDQAKKVKRLYKTEGELRKEIGAALDGKGTQNKIFDGSLKTAASYLESLLKKSSDEETDKEIEELAGRLTAAIEAVRSKYGGRWGSNPLIKAKRLERNAEASIETRQAKADLEAKKKDFERRSNKVVDNIADAITCNERNVQICIVKKQRAYAERLRLERDFGSQAKSMLNGWNDSLAPILSTGVSGEGTWDELTSAYEDMVMDLNAERELAISNMYPRNGFNDDTNPWRTQEEGRIGRYRNVDTTRVSTDRVSNRPELMNGRDRYMNERNGGSVRVRR